MEPNYFYYAAIAYGVPFGIAALLFVILSILNRRAHAFIVENVLDSEEEDSDENRDLEEQKGLPCIVRFFCDIFATAIITVLLEIIFEKCILAYKSILAGDPCPDFVAECFGTYNGINKYGPFQCKKGDNASFPVDPPRLACYGWVYNDMTTDQVLDAIGVSGGLLGLVSCIVPLVYYVSYFRKRWWWISFFCVIIPLTPIGVFIFLILWLYPQVLSVLTIIAFSLAITMTCGGWLWALSSSCAKTEYSYSVSNNNDSQHDCLYVAATLDTLRVARHIIPYCMGEWPSKWNIKENNFGQKFAFAELSKLHITSQQLYMWSAPMDVIEDYQFYLNQLSDSKKTSMAMFSIKPKTISDECWIVFKCTIGMPIVTSELCDEFCSDESCVELVKQRCPDIIYAPVVPVFLGHVFLVYDKNNLNYESDDISEPMFICYDSERLHVPDDNKTIQLPNNTNTCRLYKDSITDTEIYTHHLIDRYLLHLGQWLATDDEDMNMWDKNCSLKRNSNYYKCETTNECIPQHYVKDGTCHCLIHHSEYCDDENYDTISRKSDIKFYEICDGAIHLFPQIINNETHTDETECDQWPCNNIHNYNDGIWHCLNGIDEINFKSKLLLNCLANNHICVSYETNELMCLPMEKVNDGIIDCIGAGDEPTLCPSIENVDDEKRFYCKTDSRQSCIAGRSLCDKYPDCTNKEDERACKSVDLARSRRFYGICESSYHFFGSDIAKVLCPRFRRSLITKKFKLSEIQDSSVTLESTRIVPRRFMTKRPLEYQPRCHRGINLQVWSDKEKNLTTSTCLCPPSYYELPLIIIISLIDDTKKHCQEKFHIYLLYSTRPKNETKQYSIHIDIYEKKSLVYRGSVLKSILFSFLPVYRLSFQMSIPRKIEYCSNRSCIKGKCVKYFNHPNSLSFCQCNEGWSGRYCTIQHQCDCSSDSVCIGKLLNNRSLCICPVNKMGHRCLLTNTIVVEMFENSSPSRLLCFYDEKNLCSCQNHDQQYLANCLQFDHNMKMNCEGKSGCENDGECYQDDFKCPKEKLCKCQKCFYGTRCHLSTNGFSLSLDNILGYHIKPNINLQNQPFAVLGNYPSSIRTINSILSSFHFIVPFIINIISAS
ncbi:hypothetical protein I4U23_005361 [Adineta vaga]|nr:hypothetical protein I4U23_005361 [Adineta vaga]